MVNSKKESNIYERTLDFLDEKKIQYKLWKNPENFAIYFYGKMMDVS